MTSHPAFEVKSIQTQPIEGQKTGTSGLRKKVKVFQSPNYLANWVQSLFNSLKDLKGKTLVLGGDGRYFNKEAIQICLKLAAGNKVGKVLVGHNGILSTPAVSCIIRKYKAYGGIILTASHNPGGPENDFGIKYNTDNGGPAPESVTNEIYKHTLNIKEYHLAQLPEIDLSKIASHRFGNDFEVEVIDSVKDYAEMVSSIFDFPLIRSFLEKSKFKILIDSLSGVTGAYTQHIFCQMLGAPANSVTNNTPLEDFGGHHPDPNLTYAHDLVKAMWTGEYDFGCASDGDGDRNMILGKKFFVNPSDSLAIIGANAQECIPYFSKGLKALARSMPTSAASDRVAKKLGVASYEVPTGWKFFGNLMEKYANEGTPQSVICGEESFGTGSDHIREKDGIWAMLAWLNIVAYKNKNSSTIISIEDICKDHWKSYGRNYFSRYDYEECESAGANELMNHLTSLQGSIVGKSFGDLGEISLADDFQYNDPVDGSVTKNQGLRFVFKDGSRFVFRLSGTGSSGATIRLYVEKYESSPDKLFNDPQDALKPLIQVALEVSKLQHYTGRTSPTVIT
eukprot:TRINITY_DN1379_c0_g1_i1.p1 TRINITY_DN1379_c0_g1~~TRINITY_DN1379_c0_g1_i1.p1  ORF type:complete len:565 (+),score=142.14 TRINITY_DN1379_c0_g1_i1:76-1770(+)